MRKLIAFRFYEKHNGIMLQLRSGAFHACCTLDIRSPLEMRDDDENKI